MFRFLLLVEIKEEETEMTETVGATSAGRSIVEEVGEEAADEEASEVVTDKMLLILRIIPEDIL